MHCDYNHILSSPVCQSTSTLQQRLSIVQYDELLLAMRQHLVPSQLSSLLLVLQLKSLYYSVPEAGRASEAFVLFQA